MVRILVMSVLVAAACSGSQRPSGPEHDGCYEACLRSCGQETRAPDAPSCPEECTSVCDRRGSTGAGSMLPADGGVAPADGSSTGAIFTTTDP